MHDCVIIGAGAAGILAALSASKKHKRVLICDKKEGIGKKILASGNGRCNLLNDRLDESFYNIEARDLVKSVFSRFGKKEILDFFKAAGLEVHSDSGRIFPVTNQSSSVVKVLEIALDRGAILVELGFDADCISREGDHFTIKAKNGKRFAAKKVILAGGGKSYPALGSDGSAYLLAKQFGHKIVDPVPSAVGLVVKDRLCHFLQGQRIFADIKAYIGPDVVAKSEGDLLFTKYGLSGASILDISREISVAINRYRKKDTHVVIDMAPFIKRDELLKTVQVRTVAKFPKDDILVGILPNKFGRAILEGKESLSQDAIVTIIKEKRFDVTATRGWNEAEFTAGGVSLDGIDDYLQSRYVKGLYFAGEILDVDGARGGYNLAWAWASGHVAGLGGNL